MSWSLLILAVILGASGLMGLNWAVNAGANAWIGVLAGLGACMGFIALVVFMQARSADPSLGPKVKDAWRWFVLRDLSSVDLADARRASRSFGSSKQFGEMTVWTDAGEEVAHELGRIAEQTESRLSALTGRSGGMGRIDVICFGSSGAFDAFVPESIRPGYRVGGWYGGWFRRRMVLWVESDASLLQDFRAEFVLNLATHWLRKNVGRLPAWITTGVCHFVSAESMRIERADGTGLRRFRAQQQRDCLFSGAELAAVTARDLSQRLKTWMVAEDIAFVDHFNFQCRQLIAYLAQYYPSELQRLFSAHANESFEDSVGMSLDDAVEGWVRSTCAQELPPHAAPPPALKAKIEAELVAPLLDERTPKPTRLQHIRRFGALGYVWKAQGLVELLSNEDAWLRLWSVYALENLAGEVRGETPQRWREWWDGLPQKVTGADS